ncbi:HTH-type transcriptional regulator MtrR [Ruminiclostridium hungatei]|uniref:HTH-type transcriptional regulator MtrR n=1 Tax=Ruminiclostridium hungatei TaxID=48256 RepID=A0A1V4SJX2_RUMHU|nr:TetR/AcrR family transcriptional regulator [Ruminiclostridium hungatei]OPX44083.1 HTH-type transcriptional regulator MtrR [Ruminiclostridium hungatei]
MRKTMRQIKKEKTKELILETAYELFSRQGILNTRMSDIAQAAGVSHGTVFLHFETQESLIAGVVEFYCRSIAGRTHELAESCANLQDFLIAHLQGITEYESFYSRLVIENRMLPVSAREVWINMQSAVSQHFSQVMDHDRQSIRTDVPLSMLFNMWMGLIHYYLENSDLFAPGESVLQRYSKELCNNYYKLIIAGRKEHHEKSI